MIQLNKYQTTLTDELLAKYPEEVQTELFDYINNVPFIQNLISPNREYAKDRPRDAKGRIIIDLVNPHILEDMDYFRETAIHYEKHGVFTNLKPNTSPQSPFMKWFKREIWRCWNGMIRPDDGEWITGNMYFYLNYFPIIKSIQVKGTNIADRTNAFPDVWEGVYWRFHYMDQARFGGLYNDFLGAQHCCEIASRGKSKSYSLASVMAKSFSLGLNQGKAQMVKVLVLAHTLEYLDGDAILNKFVEGIDFLRENTEFPSLRLRDSMSALEWKQGYKTTDGVARGSGNQILAQAISNDPDKPRGKRSDYMFIEEFGNFPKFLDMLGVTRANVQEMSLVFGLFYAIGTGGSEGSDFSGALELIYNPKGYNVYGLPNVYDKGIVGDKKTIFFFPAYVNAKPFYNHDGVSDVIMAMLTELMERYVIKYNSSDPMKLTRQKAEFAFTLQDAVMRRDSTQYPVSDLNDRVLEIESTASQYDGLITGRLSANSEGEVVYVPDTQANPIMIFPHKDNKLEGAILIHQMPITNSSGTVPWGRYIAGCDPYDDDESGTLSLFSFYILDLWTDELVFEYTGRPMFASDAYEIARKACIFYNAECNYENNKKGLFGHFQQNNALTYLADTLEFLKDRDMVKESYGNKSKGTPNYGRGKGAVAPFARTLVRNFLLKPITTTHVNDKEEIIEVTIKNLQRIKFRPLLKELANWNPDGNFDRHDALCMLMLLREDKLIKNGSSSFSDTEVIEKEYLGNDEYFEKNFKAHRWDVKGGETDVIQQLIKAGVLKDMRELETN